MGDPVFFQRGGPISLQKLIEITGAELRGALVDDFSFEGVAPLDMAQSRDVAFLDNPAYLPQLETTCAGVVLIAPKYVARAREGLPLLVTPDPYRAYARVIAEFYPDAKRPRSIYGNEGIALGCWIHPETRLENDVIIDPGAVIGRGAEIGSGTVIAANAVIGEYVRIGRNCSIGAGASISHALVGNRVIIHGGVRIGQDGFGFAMGPAGHLKVPQVGRVIVQDDVEIGANTCIDRGAGRDTMIGEGTKIDNLVQIGHNVVIGRHCVIVSQVGISGSTVLEDYVVLAGQVGLVGHVRVGMGAQIAGSSSVRSDVPAGEKWGGTPARPIREWFREMTALKKLAARTSIKSKSETEE